MVLKLNITQRLPSMRSPNRIMRKLSRKPKPTKGNAEAAKSIRS